MVAPRLAAAAVAAMAAASTPFSSPVAAAGAVALTRIATPAAAFQSAPRPKPPPSHPSARAAATTTTTDEESSAIARAVEADSGGAPPSPPSRRYVPIPIPTRRAALSSLAASSVAAAVGLAGAAVAPPPALADEATATATPTPTATATSSYPPVTHRAYLDVRISRSDGTFYVRDDLPDLPENRVFYGRLELDLYGTASPSTVTRFLTYLDVPYDVANDNPLPGYGRSSFPSFDQRTGLLTGGMIPGLELTNIGGGTNLRYGGRILPAPLWIEKRGGNGGGDGGGGGGGGGREAAAVVPRPSHSLGRGLLTHRSLDALPAFGITTRPVAEPDLSDLDATSVVFGRIRPTTDSDAFLNIVVDLPTYSTDRPTTSADAPRSEAERAAETAAAKVFAVQREFFRGAARTFGDTRLDKVYEGKLLRRVEVVKAGML